ncbi:MAG TPA: hypothetical protein VFM32_08210, partial [Spongiibacteraceae bacterium]|nr:hypothetical protein [Spongiibacteraceae bacterium]
MNRSIQNPTQNSAYPLMLFAIYAVVWLALAIAPVDRHDWLLENTLVFIALPILIARHRKQPF